MKNFNPAKDTRDFENESHIVRKKKAEAKKHTIKNYRDKTQFVDNIDDEEFDINDYARYIK